MTELETPRDMEVVRDCMGLDVWTTLGHRQHWPGWSADVWADMMTEVKTARTDAKALAKALRKALDRIRANDDAMGHGYCASQSGDYRDPCTCGYDDEMEAARAALTAHEEATK